MLVRNIAAGLGMAGDETALFESIQRRNGALALFRHHCLRLHSAILQQLQYSVFTAA